MRLPSTILKTARSSIVCWVSAFTFFELRSHGVAEAIVYKEGTPPAWFIMAASPSMGWTYFSLKFSIFHNYTQAMLTNPTRVPALR
jgi:hypothetical protein